MAGNGVNTEDRSLHQFLWERCGLPRERSPLHARIVGTVELEDARIEKLVYDAEPGSSVTAHLYVPKGLRAPAPALVMANGHGGSKSSFFNQYAGQLYAKAGVVVLTSDTIGEEERDQEGRLGYRGHDKVAQEAHRLGRPTVGKMVWDLMRGIDYLEERPDLVDPGRIGVGGHSLGAMVGAYLAALDDRIHLALLAAMYFHRSEAKGFCLFGMYRHIEERLDYPQLLAMAAPHCATLMLAGSDDPICGDNYVFRNGFLQNYAITRELFARAGASDHLDRQVYENQAHRPYQLCREAVLWVEEHIGLPNWSRDDVLGLHTVRLGDWTRDNGVTMEPAYGTDQHYAGAMVLDVGARHVVPPELACLGPEERGSPSFTVEGWIARIGG